MEDEEARTIFVLVVEAEERVKLIKNMISKGVGFPEVEYIKLVINCHQWNKYNIVYLSSNY